MPSESGPRPGGAHDSRYLLRRRPTTTTNRSTSGPTTDSPPYAAPRRVAKRAAVRIWTTGVAAPAAPVECLAFTSRRRPVRARSLPCTTSIINGTTGTLDGGGYRVRTTTHLLAVHGTAASSFTTELVASVMPGYRS